MDNFIEELNWRGMIHDIMPGTEDVFNKGMTAAYIGFDPTADSLHIGNLVQIMTLVHLQKSGHKPFVLLGGATGMVGDPSGKSKERNLLSEEVLLHNLKSVEKQLRKFLNFDSEKNKAEIVNNYDWFKEMSFLKFIRDVGKHITVNYMMSKDSVKNRLKTGMSFTEFSYQLVQAYDFWWLYKNKKCKVQLGGSDQWGNIVTGTELIRKKSNAEAFAVTTPLIKKADGTKFGKTEGGNVWLDRNKTSPYKFYQYWLNTSDEDAKNYIKIFTLLSKNEIQILENKHNEAPHLRVLQKTLAKNITIKVHSLVDFEMAVKASSILFGKSTTKDLQELDELTLLAVFEGVSRVNVAKSKLNCTLVEFLSGITENKIFSSKGEARRMLKGGGISINKQKLTQGEDSKLKTTLLQEKYILVQKGKKNYYLVTVK